MDARDGNFFYDGCNSPFFYFPGGPCPLGATGFVSRGLENDPELRGLGPYFSVTELSAAVLLNPFDSVSAKLISAPPSLLPRPNAGFVDKSLSVFFDLQTPNIRQYPIALYEFTRNYLTNERTRFDGEVVPGTYRYSFASLANPLVPINIDINQFPKLDGYRKINSQPQGVRFKNVTYDDGFAVLNPFVLNTITWEGNTSSLIFPSVDLSYFSIKRLTDPTDPLSDPVIYNLLGPFIVDPTTGFLIPNPTIPLFPNFAGASDTRVLLQNALNTSFILPPNFIDPGQTGVIDLEFVIYRPTSGVVYENSTRRFRLPVKVTNPFVFFIQAALPPGATAQQMAADYDYDGDGVSNFTEWVFGSDPKLKSSVPGSPGLNTVTPTPPAGQTALKFNPGEGSQSTLEYKVPKLKNTVPALKYSIEYSADMKIWTQITSSNPAWILSETHDQIKVTGSSTNPGTGGFFRTKVQPQ